MKLSTAARSAAADAAVAEIDKGSSPGHLYFQDSSSGEVAKINFEEVNEHAFGGATSGEATLNNTPLSDSDVAGGTIATGTSPYGALIRDSDDTTIFSLSVTVSGGGGDIEISSLTFSSGETLRLDSMTYTQPEGS